MLLDTPFDTFRHRFEDHLAELLAPDQPGAFILVLANAMQDAALHARLAEGLAATWTALRAALAAGTLQGAPDDLAVLERLAEHGIDGYHSWRQRDVPPWRLAFNPLRALRPARASRDRFTTLQRPFDPRGFHFDKPFLRPEVLAETDFEGTPLRVMYHKFPFAPYHLLLVPEPTAGRAQYLGPADHERFWRLTARVARHLPGFGLGYNSLGAGASINHLHTHGIVDPAPLPIEGDQWRHNGGPLPYPLAVTPLDDRDAAWQAIAALHRRQQPYNLFYRPGRCYLITRRPQGSPEMAPWLRGAGWYEACGGFNLSDEATFQALTAARIERDLASLRVPAPASA